jgi:CDP-glucose 4,6-dehydratase
MRAYRSGQAVEIRNAASVRPWQFVLEPVYGYLKLGEKLLSHGKEFSGGWNFGPAAYENYSVGDVVEELRRTIPAVRIESPRTSEKRHEAGLLKLDITKAVNLLGWKPRLDFEQTIRFTLEGYLEELSGSGDLYKSRVEQIKKYCSA